ncbi:MAG: A/G-specific adenine glycosylase [Anaerovoracaceae bacterium]|jgi:A/G-specific adenine glycosylase
MTTKLNENIKQFQNKLLEWYSMEARELPWRSDPTPYKVWISEIMLQQTRVDTVIPYFLRFIAEAPTISELAKMEEETLLKLWQGLGYYNRALNLKKASIKIQQDFNGVIPSNIKDLMSLPGIGPYTAGAIASIAFGQAVPAVDGNVLRIVARVTASSEDISLTATKKNFESIVRTLVPKNNPGDFNQALMDLGATICLPNGQPKCAECPVQSLCQANLQGIISEIPVRTNKKARSIEKRTVLIIDCDGTYALQKRDKKGLLPNLWEFPNFEGHLTEQQCIDVLYAKGIKAINFTTLKPSKHIFTHLEWHMTGYFFQGTRMENESSYVWATKDEIKHKYSVPTAFKAYTAAVK